MQKFTHAKLNSRSYADNHTVVITSVGQYMCEINITKDYHYQPSHRWIVRTNLWVQECLVKGRCWSINKQLAEYWQNKRLIRISNPAQSVKKKQKKTWYCGGTTLICIWVIIIPPSSAVNLLGGSISTDSIYDVVLTYGAKRKDKLTVVCLFMSGIMGSTPQWIWCSLYIQTTTSAVHDIMKVSTNLLAYPILVPLLHCLFVALAQNYIRILHWFFASEWLVAYLRMCKSAHW